MWNLLKIGQTVSEKTKINNFTILYMYIAKGQGTPPPPPPPAKKKKKKKKKNDGN